MKLELKHIAPYLPYKLQWYHSNRKGTHLITLYNANTIISAVNNQNYKIALRPMSDLYKEINGEVGIVEIYQKMFIYPKIRDYHIESDCLKFGKHTFEWLYEFNGFSLDGEAAYILLEVADYLDSRHYDWRYNLLDQNLAINLNEIE